MSSNYAVLGATGNVGQSIIKTLLESPARQIHAFCRSKSKLHKHSPNTENNSQVQIFEGDISDIDTLTSCVRSANAVFLATAIKDNQPGCSIAIDTAHSLIQALTQLRKENIAKLPKVIVLSSCTTEYSHFMKANSAFFNNLLYAANSNIYNDLREAETYLREQAQGLLDFQVSFVKPGALTDDARKGHSLSTEEAKFPLSFLDLAAGMVELADDSTGRYDLKSVAVNPTAKDVAFPQDAPGHLITGLLVHFFPWLAAWLF